MDCNLEKHFQSAVCKKRFRNWWLFVGVLLLIMVTLWVFVTVYLLLPHGSQVINKPIILRNEKGENSSVVVFQPIPRNSLEPHVVAKQQHVKVYDVNQRKWLRFDSPLSLIPFRDGFYLVIYDVKEQLHRHVEFENGELMITSHVFNVHNYFFGSVFGSKCHHLLHFI